MRIAMQARDGDEVTAKRIGWQGDNVTETDILDPYDYTEAETEVRGTLHVVTADGPFVERHENYLVNGQVVDPDTIRPIGEVRNEEEQMATRCGMPTLDGTPCQRFVAPGSVDCGVANSHRPTRPVAVIPTGLLKPERPVQPGEEAFHKPGKHNQKEHGRKGDAPGGAPAAKDTPAESVLTGADALAAVPRGYQENLSSDSPDWRVNNTLGHYRAEDFKHVNSRLREQQGDNEGGSLSTRNTVKAMDTFIESSPIEADIETYRGVHNPRKMFGDKWSNDDLTGLEWQDHAYTSVSTDRKIGEGFALGYDPRNAYEHGMPVVFRIRYPKGTKAVTLSGAKNESEVLVKRGGHYRVVGDRQQDRLPDPNALNDEQTYRLLDVEYVTD